MWVGQKNQPIKMEIIRRIYYLPLVRFEARTRESKDKDVAYFGMAQAGKGWGAAWDAGSDGCSGRLPFALERLARPRRWDCPRKEADCKNEERKKNRAYGMKEQEKDNKRRYSSPRKMACGSRPFAAAGPGAGYRTKGRNPID